MKQVRWLILFYAGLLFTVVLLNACNSIRNFTGTPHPWSNGAVTTIDPVLNDSTKKNVFIIADYKLTELFDMIAPFYLFNATQRANVYIVAANENPILIKKDLFVVPQLTFDRVDAMQLKADVIVIPALSVRNDQQDSVVVNWIQNHVTPTTRLLSICDGASTAAATGLYDGKSITCHASDYAGIKKYFPKPAWVQNVSVAKSGNLYSTAGVSNAVEGSLLVIDDLFGSQVMSQSMKEVNYPSPGIRIDHKSVAVSGHNKLAAIKKIFFTKNKNLGFLVENGIDEFQLVSVLDTYSRTFPASMSIYIPNDTTVKTKFGLRLIYTGGATIPKLDEFHVLTSTPFTKEGFPGIGKAKIIRYERLETEYTIDACLVKIKEEFGHKFADLVKISLDYN